MIKAIDLSEPHAKIVRDILRAHLPAATRAFVFGSRATATARRYSDLDLALENDIPLPPDILGNLTEALSESDLPFKVDVIDLRHVDPEFCASIEPGLIAFQY